MKNQAQLVSVLLLILHPLVTVSFLQVSPNRRNYHHASLRTPELVTNNHRRYPLPPLLETKSTKNDYEEETFLTNAHLKTNKNNMPKITTILGLTEFLDFLAEYDERILVVEFYASWCKSCHKFGQKYKQLARKYADKVDENGEIVEEGKIRFAQVEYGANVHLCRSFGIKKLPYVQIYKAPLGKITEFVCGPKYFDDRLVKPLEEYLVMTDDEIQFRMNMEEGQALGDRIVEEVRGLAKKENTTSID
mmetsp:Transcript_19199/g.28758  ORF Transcript_19199/g.28758 Transcript_19199/m.28758 type:complete len:248 (-) Transcript_19199:1512-2255(-)